MDFAVVGCGRWGQNVIRTLRDLESTENLQLREVVHTGNPDRASNISEQYNLPCHTDLGEAIDRNDAVCVVTPDETHPRLTRRILEDKTDVFVEKPLAFDLEECRELYDLADRNDCRLMVGHLMLFHPVLAELKSRPEFQTDNLSEIRVSRLSDLREVGERRLPYSSLIHDISLLDALYEAVPSRINVLDATGPYPPGASLTVRLEYSTTPVRIHARSDWPFPDRTITFRSQNTFLRFDGLEENLTILDGTKEDTSGETVTFDSLPLTDELRNFARVCSRRATPAVSQDHVVRVMKTLDELEQHLIGVIGD